MSADGTKVFVAFAESGNRTTLIPASLAPPQPSPTNQNLPAPPQVSRIVDAHPDVRVIVFTAYDVDEYVFGAIRAGAKGYVLKGSPAHELVRAIRQVHAGACVGRGKRDNRASGGANRQRSANCNRLADLTPDAARCRGDTSVAE